MSVAVPHYVYEALDEDGTFLYVGCTKNLPERAFMDHRRKSGWWPRMCQMKVTRHETRAEAMHYEALRIAQKRPLFNVQHNLDTSPVDSRITWAEKFANDHTLGIEHPMRDKCPDCLKLVFGVVLG